MKHTISILLNTFPLLIWAPDLENILLPWTSGHLRVNNDQNGRSNFRVFKFIGTIPTQIWIQQSWFSEYTRAEFLSRLSSKKLSEQSRSLFAADLLRAKTYSLKIKAKTAANALVELVLVHDYEYSRWRWGFAMNEVYQK